MFVFSIPILLSRSVQILHIHQLGMQCIYQCQCTQGKFISIFVSFVLKSVLKPQQYPQALRGTLDLSVVNLLACTQKQSKNMEYMRIVLKPTNILCISKVTKLVFQTGSNVAFSVWSKGPLAKFTPCLGYSVGRSWCKFLLEVGVLLLLIVTFAHRGNIIYRGTYMLEFWFHCIREVWQIHF